MITDSQIKKISLLVALIGLLLIFVAATWSEPQQIAITDITADGSGRTVLVNGTAESVRVSEGNVFLKVSDGTGNITAVMFERTARDNPEVYQLKKYDNVTVKGQVNIYKSELEIIASSITRTDEK